MLVVAAPVSASIPEAGSRIGLYFPPTTFPANTPFHITHGFACDVGDAGCISTQINGTSNFSLYVDGVLQPSKRFALGGQGGIGKFWLINFWNGLAAGDHIFRGVWSIGGIVTQTLSVTITFTQ
jgi:hypothetical protein